MFWMLPGILYTLEETSSEAVFKPIEHEELIQHSSTRNLADGFKAFTKAAKQRIASLKARGSLLKASKRMLTDHETTPFPPDLQDLSKMWEAREISRFEAVIRMSYLFDIPGCASSSRTR